MDQLTTIQQEIFSHLKERLPSNISMVGEIAELLGLSLDSAYRRIRGEKPLTLEELIKLQEHYRFSFDSFLNNNNENITFRASIIEHEKFKVSQWLDKILEDIVKIGSAREKEIIYVAKDPPLFHYFQLPEIAAFKVFFWEKTLFQFPEYEEKKFDPENVDHEVFKKGQKLLAIASKIPTIEIWNENTFRILLSQIEFCWISGLITKKEHVQDLLDKIEKWICHIRREAEFGFKFLCGHEPEGIENTYQLYFNEVVYNDNSILVKTEKGYSAYLTFNVLSLLNTTNQNFCCELNRYFRGLIKKSTLISNTGSKERDHFFNEQLNEVSLFKKRLMN